MATPYQERKMRDPAMNPGDEPYFQAAAEGKLLIKKCNACGEVHHYPRDVCPHCLSTDTAWLQSAGAGVVYSFSTMGKGDAAYTLAFVTLDEGLTLMTNLVDCDPMTLAIGQRVEVVFKPSDGGHPVPMFTPA